MTPTILCLAHGADDRPNGCGHADECQRHVAIRARHFPEGSKILTRACPGMEPSNLVPIPINEQP